MEDNEPISNEKLRLIASPVPIVAALFVTPTYPQPNRPEQLSDYGLKCA